MNNLQDNIRTLRTSRGLTRKKLSEDLGIKLATYGSWEQKLSYPGIDNIILLAEYFDTGIADLIGHSEWREPKNPPTEAGLYLVKYKKPIEKRWYGTEVYVNGIWMCKDIKQWKPIN